jgi:hypothetical protein
MARVARDINKMMMIVVVVFQVEVFSVVTPCSVMLGYQRFRGPCWLHLHPENGVIMVGYHNTASLPRRPRHEILPPWKSQNLQKMMTQYAVWHILFLDFISFESLQLRMEKLFDERLNIGIYWFSTDMNLYVKTLMHIFKRMTWVLSALKLERLAQQRH